MKQRVILYIPPQLVSRPMIYDLVKNYDVSFNILRAQVMEDEEGMLTLEFAGTKASLAKAIDVLQKQGVRVRELARYIQRDSDKCTHCGACVGQCPTGALSTRPADYEVQFDETKCILCELCVPACAFGAMSAAHQTD
ncbi:MAG TPA: 4Fe-4S binding protein [Planctomycetota bacterium]|nr:4Fe-4S binding protein [Planctomycetota bacterium]